jgi:hypothetical protein
VLSTKQITRKIDIEKMVISFFLSRHESGVSRERFVAALRQTIKDFTDPPATPYSPRKNYQDLAQLK